MKKKDTQKKKGGKKVAPIVFEDGIEPHKDDCPVTVALEDESGKLCSANIRVNARPLCEESFVPFPLKSNISTVLEKLAKLPKECSTEPVSNLDDGGDAPLPPNSSLEFGNCVFDFRDATGEAESPILVMPRDRFPHSVSIPEKLTSTSWITYAAAIKSHVCQYAMVFIRGIEEGKASWIVCRMEKKEFALTAPEESLCVCEAFEAAANLGLPVVAYDLFSNIRRCSASAKRQVRVAEAMVLFAHDILEKMRHPSRGHEFTYVMYVAGELFEEAWKLQQGSNDLLLKAAKCYREAAEFCLSGRLWVLKEQYALQMNALGVVLKRAGDYQMAGRAYIMAMKACDSLSPSSSVKSPVEMRGILIGLNHSLASCIRAMIEGSNVAKEREAASFNKRNAQTGKNDKSNVRPCAACGVVAKPLLCSGCRGTTYCSEVCQHKHWPHHKAQCAEIKKFRQEIVDTK